MKIKAINEKIRSTKLQVPYDGLISIDANGIAEVSDKAAEILVNGTNDWSYLKKVKEVKEDKKAAETTENAPVSEETPEEEVEEVMEEPEEEDESKAIIDGIKKMSLKEMLDMAAEAGYPESEYEKFAKKDKMMAAYLIKKYNDSQK